MPTHHREENWKVFDPPVVSAEALAGLKRGNTIKIVHTNGERFWVYVMDVQGDNITGLCLVTMITTSDIDIGDFIHCLKKNVIFYDPRIEHNASDVLTTIHNQLHIPRSVRVEQTKSLIRYVHPDDVTSVDRGFTKAVDEIFKNKK